MSMDEVLQNDGFTEGWHDAIFNRPCDAGGFGSTLAEKEAAEVRAVYRVAYVEGYEAFDNRTDAWKEAYRMGFQDGYNHGFSESDMEEEWKSDLFGKDDPTDSP